MPRLESSININVNKRIIILSKEEIQRIESIKKKNIKKYVNSIIVNKKNNE